MGLDDTIALMQSTDFRDRFKAEYLQLKIRINALATMLEKYKAGTLAFTPNCSYDLLNRQLRSMELYALALKERAEIEGIELYI